MNIYNYDHKAKRQSYATTQLKQCLRVTSTIKTMKALYATMKQHNHKCVLACLYASIYTPECMHKAGNINLIQRNFFKK